jgi:hypothetical protein
MIATSPLPTTTAGPLATPDALRAQLRRRGQLKGRQPDDASRAEVRVVERVQVFDQKVAPVRTGADQGAHLGARSVIGLAALELAAAPELGTQGVGCGQGNRGGGWQWTGGNHGLVVVRARCPGRMDNGHLRGGTWQYERHRHSHMSRAA